MICSCKIPIIVWNRKKTREKNHIVNIVYDVQRSTRSREISPHRYEIISVIRTLAYSMKFIFSLLYTRDLYKKWLSSVSKRNTHGISLRILRRVSPNVSNSKRNGIRIIFFGVMNRSNNVRPEPQITYRNSVLIQQGFAWFRKQKFSSSFYPWIQINFRAYRVGQLLFFDRYSSKETHFFRLPEEEYRLRG